MAPPRAAPERESRDHGGLAESGRGFAIMSACVDEVTLRLGPGPGHRVVLDKRIAWDPARSTRTRVARPVRAELARFAERERPPGRLQSVRIGVVTFPGSLDDTDAARAVRYAGAEPVSLWHADPDLRGVDAVILPGGFSYGDYLRCGAIARFSPVMAELIPAAQGGAAGARHLQRLPDPVRGPPAARRADQERQAAASSTPTCG